MEKPESEKLVKLMELLLRQGCTHRFSWPRIDSDGRHYQVCLACGVAYEYDWQMMRRTNRLLLAPVQDELHGGSIQH
jgi:hypothetical protein